VLADVEALDPGRIVAAGEDPGVGLHVPALGTAEVCRLAVLDVGVVVVEAAPGGDVAVVAVGGRGPRVAEVEAADVPGARLAGVVRQAADTVVAGPPAITVTRRHLSAAAALRQLVARVH